MIIRKAAVDDVQAILKVHTRSVESLCARDYTPKQIRAWVDNKKTDKYIEVIQRDPTFVAEIGGTIVGFIRFRPSTNELSSIFVDPDYVRQGIASKLFKKACDEAKHLDLTYFWLDASLTAVPFYDAMGFIMQGTTTHKFSGVDLKCLRMHKSLD
jgi:putative acetyltransferase